MPERTVYAASKSAMTRFAWTWALEPAHTGMTANGAAPGPPETESFRENTPAGSIDVSPFTGSGGPDRPPGCHARCRSGRFR
ncbi:SDR family NAD(P)-dependent oxidoreductase [Massilia sp. NEAU-DD11]|uniref:SDR family NAD(P)-dependent oxidoreductase n=1 Tax=Massilia cellulosiltytica TaxID=2683234 RepID=A0A7X3K6N6_9BURK|nr:SDR family NAD(P)-dependent oxidoreductase [Telluria cellulosilytica]